MINIPQIQNQERLPMDKQVKNIRVYLVEIEPKWNVKMIIT